MQFCTRFQKENVERKTLKDESIKRFPCEEQPGKVGTPHLGKG